MNSSGEVLTKRITKTNVIQMPKAKSSEPSKDDRLSRAQLKVYDAWESFGKRRVTLAREALAISEDCADAYIVLAEKLKNGKQRIPLYRKAIAAGERALGADWRTKYKGVCWGVHETRPVMRAIAKLAMELQSEDEFSEAIQLYRSLLELNPGDNQGIRNLMLGCLYEAGCDEELERLLDAYPGDIAAEFAYTHSLYLFRKHGATKESLKALKSAFKANKFVPVLLSGMIEMPAEAPSAIGFGDEREAIAYVKENGHLWWNTEGATEWMSDSLATSLRKSINDRELAEAVIAAMKG
jgi:tetratricopeptide (TPR) repeat protein